MPSSLHSAGTEGPVLPIERMCSVLLCTIYRIVERDEPLILTHTELFARPDADPEPGTWPCPRTYSRTIRCPTPRPLALTVAHSSRRRQQEHASVTAAL